MSRSAAHAERGFVDNSDNLSYTSKWGAVGPQNQRSLRKPRGMRMAQEWKEVTASELAVLEELWRQGPATIRQLTDVLYPGGSASLYATVQKLLERLEAKEYVVHERQKSINVFRVCVNRNDFVGGSLRAMAEKLSGGSLTPMLTNLVKTQSLSEGERQSLRDLLDSMDGKRKRPGK